jgi:hypothetical protein
VIADCNEALKLDKTYIKALNRRATALEALDRLEEAVRGMLVPHVPAAFTSLTRSAERCRLRCHFVLGEHVKQRYCRVGRSNPQEII